jgi:hypothetical protein
MDDMAKFVQSKTSGMDIDPAPPSDGGKAYAADLNAATGLRKFKHDPPKTQWSEGGNYKIKEDQEERYATLYPKGEYKFTLIWIQGIALSAYGFTQAFTEKAIDLNPSCKIVLPTAP